MIFIVCLLICVLPVSFQACVVMTAVTTEMPRVSSSVPAAGRTYSAALAARQTVTPLSTDMAYKSTSAISESMGIARYMDIFQSPLKNCNVLANQKITP